MEKEQNNQKHDEIVEVIKYLLVAYSKYDLTPDVINKGWCVTFAADVKNRLPYVEIISIHFPYHAFVHYNGMCYDAEAPNGVNDFMLLPIMIRFRSMQ